MGLFGQRPNCGMIDSPGFGMFSKEDHAEAWRVSAEKNESGESHDSPPSTIVRLRYEVLFAWVYSPPTMIVPSVCLRAEPLYILIV